jgi:glycosyltransferase involved in cell wall biosynthesis
MYKKKILLLSDDLRLSSGVATVARELVLGTCHEFDWVQVGAAINHPDQGKIIDLSQSIKSEFNIDCSVKVYPWNGYGNIDLIRQLINTERPDCILHITDPRYWTWLYEAEHEIRQILPIFYLSVWDNWPTPHWNLPYYKSSDMLMAISRQTHAIHKAVLKQETMQDWQFRYLPHGINQKVFYPIEVNSPEHNEVVAVRDKFNLKDKFTVFYNSRNIARKRASDVIAAFAKFAREVGTDKVALLMHTQPIDQNGTDLYAVKNALAAGVDIQFSTDNLSQPQLNHLYNAAHVTINIASNEGFGLGTAESVMAGTPIIVNVTGGLQDQCGFKKADGTYLKVTDYSEEWGSNADGTYKDCGAWAYPVFPAVRTIQGSIPTPYILDDIVNTDDVVKALHSAYSDKDKLTEFGAQGREFMLSDDSMLNAETMCKNAIEFINIALQNWTPRNRFEITKI